MAANCQIVYCYLTILNGPRAGVHYDLEPGRELKIGRGVDCDIVLTDPLCSRVHAIVYDEDEGWWVRDEQSRNGTFVNSQKVDSAQLGPGATLRVGSAEFRFERTDTSPHDEDDLHLTQTIVRDAPLLASDSVVGVAALMQNPKAINGILDLFQLSMQLLHSNNPDEVIQLALELLQQRTHAAVVGFLWMSDDGSLKPKKVLPEDAAEKVVLSESLTEAVCRQKRAVWIDNQRGEQTSSLTHFADALCVPMLRDEETLGALHLYLEHGKFDESEFDFAISTADILSAALVRTREHARLTADHNRLKGKSAGSDELIGDSKPMQNLKSKIVRIARATGCVLIRGESGAGKELVARAVHRSSTRFDRPMLSVNCAAIPRDLMESQLFGHRKGAFTGAEGDHVGWFEQADSGTLFLDEVGEMTLEGQAKLLRILEGHPFLPVGSSKEISVDVRVIAATNRDLREFVRDGKFREDLYYRLSVFELYIPPLRDRGPDIEILVHHFLDHFKEQHGRLALSLSPAAREKLLSYNWPGNVRQLRNVIDSAVVMADDDQIQPDDLGLRDVGGGEIESLRIDYWERKLIKEALLRTESNVPDAAKLLGIGRATLYRKIDEYGIKR